MNFIYSFIASCGVFAATAFLMGISLSLLKCGMDPDAGIFKTTFTVFFGILFGIWAVITLYVGALGITLLW